MRNYLVWTLTLLLTGFVFGCGDDDDADPDSGTTDTDTDTDTDSDTDSDTDTDTDTDECTAPTDVTGWGGPCHSTADCTVANTTCIKLGDMDTTQGFCTPECCNFGTADIDYCTDVGTGTEQCSIGTSSDRVNFDPPFYCMILCTTVDDCPDGTDCVAAGTSGSICYGYAPVADAGPDGG